jgi:hypothetical protein
VGLSVILIPRKSYRFLIPHGLLGAATAGLIILFADKIAQSWRYEQAWPFAVANVPLFILAAWGAVTVLFLWGLPKKGPTWTHYVYMILFAVAAVWIDGSLFQLNLRSYGTWYQTWMVAPAAFVQFWVNYLIYNWRIKIEPEPTHTSAP